MPVRMPVRQAPVPAGHRRGQPGQWEQSEETLTIPAVAASGGAAAPEPEEKDPTSEATEGARARQTARVRPATGRRPVWDGRDVSFPPLRPSAGDPAQSGAETQPGERRRSPGAARSGRSAQVLAVTGARGGLGASVLLLHLAWALGRAGRRVAMMDLDPTGGLDLLCGQSVLTGLRWADLPAEESAFRPGHLVGALPVWHAMPVLTGDVRGGPLPCAEAVLEAMRAEHDVVLVDLPRGASPPPGAGVLIVTGLDLRSAVAAESIASRLRGPPLSWPPMLKPPRPSSLLRRCRSGSWRARWVRTSSSRTSSSSPAARSWGRSPPTGSWPSGWPSERTRCGPAQPSGAPRAPWPASCCPGSPTPQRR